MAKQVATKIEQDGEKPSNWSYRWKDPPSRPAEVSFGNSTVAQIADQAATRIVTYKRAFSIADIKINISNNMDSNELSSIDYFLKK